MFYLRSLIAVTILLLLGANAYSQEIAQETLKKTLSDHPEVIIEFLKSHKSEVLQIINDAVSESRLAQEQRSFEESLKNPYKPKISERTRIRGNKAAKYTLVEYADFQCPYCGNSYPTVEKLREKYGDDLRFVYKHLPLSSIHPQALPAARYMEAISLQSEDKAWNFYDIVFKNQGKLAESFYQETAKSIGVDLDRLAADLKSEQVAAAIDADVKEAKDMGFTGTPGFLLNGVPITGAVPIDYFDNIIAKLAEQSPSSAAAAR
ncbi:MAG TPA: thioredoxin domain-containing protein [Candidatus Binatia bacterium]|jgi:protein-disulfide isomerase